MAAIAVVDLLSTLLIGYFTTHKIAWFSRSGGKYKVRGKKTHTRMTLPLILAFEAWKKRQGIAFYEVMEC